MIDRIKDAIGASMEVKQRLQANDALLARIAHAATLMTHSLRHGGKILFCGNGGSAADAQHLAAELSGRFYYDRPPLAAEALHVNTSFMTAVANDYGYEHVFSRMTRALGRPGDVLVGLSTSGNSPNIILAMEAAREIGMMVVALTGETGGAMKDCCDVLLNPPSKVTPRIQEAHITIGHILCEIVESEIYPRHD